MARHRSSSASSSPPSGRGVVMVDRRTFLRATGLGALAIGGAGHALAATRPAPGPGAVVTHLADDPILAQADALSYDRDRIFRYVADEIAYEPYAGALRGPRATLDGMAGNAVDKSLLLSQLLDAAFIETRLRVGTLDDHVSDGLGRLVVDAPAARARAVAGAASREPAEPMTSPPPDIGPIVDRLPELDAAANAWASATLDSSTGLILDALDAAGITLPAGPTPGVTPAHSSHVWVQARSGSDWIDLDPTLPGAEIGRTLGQATGDPVEGVPDDLRHRLDITLVVERVAGDQLVEETVIEHASFADELTDVSISVGHARPEGLQALGGALGQLLTGGVRYHPVLRVGDTTLIGTSALLVAGGQDDILGVDPGVPNEGEAVSERLEVTITAPGGRVTRASRMLFDRVGEDGRGAGVADPAAIVPAELHALGPDGMEEYPPLRGVHFLSVATGATRRPSVPAAVAEDERMAAALGMPAAMYHVTRDTANVVLGLERGAAVHLDAPNVTMHSYVPVVDTDGSVRVVESIDLLHRSFAARPVTGVPASVPLGLLAGVTSHVAERLRMGEGLPPDLVRRPAALGAGAIVERAVAAGSRLRVMRSEIPADADYPPAASARLAAALADGWVAIVPERPVTIEGEARLGWWLVDPTTGSTVDMLDDGRGATMVEWATIVVLVQIVAVVAIYCLGSASRAAAWNAWVAQMQSDAAQLGAAVGDLPTRDGACS